MRGTRPRPGPIGTALAAVLALACLMPGARAERIYGVQPGLDAIEESLFPDPLVMRAQSALASAGFYHGSIHGRMTIETEDAVRTYQKKNRIKADGKITEALVKHIETSARIDVLLERLEDTRFKNIERARQALLNDPRTRRLLDGPDDAERADPTRDTAPCFADPTPACLLGEAVESAKTVGRNELRDWALGEVLVAQAKAGLVDEAMETVARIGDPRLIVVALRDIAKAQAGAGRAGAALSMTEIIPNPSEKAEALAEIARLQVEGGDAPGAIETSERLLELVDRVEKPSERLSLRVRAAAVLDRAGKRAQSDQVLERAEAQVRESEGSARDSGLRQIAASLATQGRVARALALIEGVGDAGERTPVLVAAAAALARAGFGDKALSTAEGIAAERYRAVVLSRVVMALADLGRIEGLEAVLDKAQEALEPIKFPYAKAYATSRVASARARLAAHTQTSFAAAVALAETIGDDRLRARTLWAIAAERRRIGDAAGERETIAKAEAATAEMKSSLSRVWLWGDMASTHALAGEMDLARKAFGLGLKEAEDIGNPWGRARALAKIATTLVDLNQPERER